MTDIEKVIKGLEIHTKPNSRCVGCPYPNNGLCGDQLYVDALALLKEQEPRVMTLDELKQFEGSPCWFESHGTYMVKEGFWIIPAMFRMFSADMVMSYTSVLNGAGGCGELGLSAYNKAWRCWTTRPTTKQREEVKWDAY